MLDRLWWPLAITIVALVGLAAFDEYDSRQDLQERQQVVIEHCAGQPDQLACAENLNAALDSVK